MIESLAVGTKILAPNDFSYPEIVNENYNLLYDSYDELMLKITKVDQTIIRQEELQEYVEPYEFVVDKWLKIMRLL